jgi:diguanylate cyclase (GGDEF)-like protein
VDTRHPEKESTSALFRLLASRLDIAALGVFQLRPNGAELWDATPEFRTVWSRRAVAPSARIVSVSPSISAALVTGHAARIDIRELGQTEGYAAVAPIREGGVASGYLLVLDRRRRWLGPRAAAELADAAHLLTVLMRPDAPASGEPPHGAAALPPGVTPLGEVGVLIDATRSERALEETLGLIVLDLDRFRAVNDAYGVPAGDRVLAQIGDRVARALAPDDVAIRMEGDRYLAVTRRRGAALRQLADGILEAVSAPLAIGPTTISLNASIGIATDDSGTTSGETLLLRADNAMKRAKLEGRNRWVLHETRLEADTQERSRLELDLAHATDAGEMHLAFQPYIDLATDRVSGAEALLRWRHPTRGDLQPAAFIPIAERSGHILSLGSWALRTALAAAQHWPDPMRLAVNISAMQFHQTDFVAQVDEALAGSDFPATRLELEITETVLMRDNPETIAQIRALIARGIHIALDDFGTGYSALAYLARLPHHRIKLDRTFVQDLANPATRNLIRAIIASARAQGIAITAEGVERPSDLEAVRGLGFTHAQGYATGKPVADPTDFIAGLSREAMA